MHTSYIQVWGTCMGFEWLMVGLSQQDDFRLDVGYDAWNISLPLNLTDDALEVSVCVCVSAERKNG